MIKFQKMYLYKLHRSHDLDHEKGRPAIFLDYFGQESLIWFGTTVKYQHINDELPFTLSINGNITYFYNKGLTKVKTNHLIGKWRNNDNQKIIKLTNEQQEELIEKFSQLTLIANPYLEIINLKEKLKKTEKILSKTLNSYLDELNKNNELTKKYQNLEQKIKAKEKQSHGQ